MSSKLVFSGCIPVSRYFFVLHPHPLLSPSISPFPFSCLTHPEKYFLLFFHSFFEIYSQGKTDQWLKLASGRLTNDCLKPASGSYQTRMPDYLSIKLYLSIYIYKSTFYKGIFCRGQNVTNWSRWFFKCVYYLTTLNKVFLVPQHSSGLIFVRKFESSLWVSKEKKGLAWFQIVQSGYKPEKELTACKSIPLNKERARGRAGPTNSLKKDTSGSAWS